jgi:NDP-sugar pyrophosphorylase family protein
MSYRVCIPCAGTGSRLGGLTQFINKSLVSIANRPTISHIIDQFSHDIEFVIALGHKGNLVREFLTLAYPEREFFFVDVSPFEGPGSGLGFSLQICKQYLQQPFVFISCDTLVKEPISPPDKNWMGYSDVYNIEAYRTITVNNEYVTSVEEKGEVKANTNTNKAYIGLAGICDYQQFWHAMDHGGCTAINIGEAHGMRSIIANGIQARAFTWHDTGNPQSLAQTRRQYRENDEPNILEKSNEAIWFVGNKVIKFSDDKKFIENRVKRAQLLKGFVPDVVNAKAHMYSYYKVEGEVLSDVVTVPFFDKLLAHGEKFWTKKNLTGFEMLDFKDRCIKFYRDKTHERVELFYKNFKQNDGIEDINGKSMPTLESLLCNVDWEWMSDGIPGTFHGDFHFENILWSSKDQRFVFLDWRQEFSGDLSIGDIYYDFAKLLHGLIVSHKLIAGDFYKVAWGSSNIEYDFHRKQILVECERHFVRWLEDQGYDRKKVWIICALIYLNIAALHHHPYGLLLFALGKSMLASELEK